MDFAIYQAIPPGIHKSTACCFTTWLD